jgi:hypothetical protein
MTRGVSTRKTSIGFHVLRLHYSSDPEKDPATAEGARWIEQAKTGMSEARWKKEFEIDYGAMGGQRVFPDFQLSVHVVERFDLKPEDWTVWMCCDPHPRTPHAFVWLAVNRDGEMVVPWSWWDPKSATDEHRMTVTEYVSTIEVIERELELKSPWRLMDIAGRGMNASEEKSYFDAYQAEGMYFQPAKKNRDMVGFEMLNTALQADVFVLGDKVERRPRLTIMEGSDELCWQLSHLRFAEWHGNVIDKDAPEQPQAKRRHLVDALMYILMDGPRFREKRQSKQFIHKPNYTVIGR